MTEPICRVLKRIDEGILSNPKNTQRSVVKRSRLSKEIFDKGIAYLEAGMQANFAPETIQVWFNQMLWRGWTDDDFRVSVMGVMGMEIFGALTIQHFVRAKEERLYTREEALELARRIANRPQPMIKCSQCGNTHQANEECEK